MTHDSPSDLGASVSARLKNLAIATKTDFQSVLTRYANERLLHRLSVSHHNDTFVLKGATLFTVWSGEPHRATRDVDFLSFGEREPARLRTLFADVVATKVVPDGVAYDSGGIHAAPIRDDQPYGGVRVAIEASISSARIRLQVDVGFGDAITPQPTVVELPSLLELPRPRLRCYPKETVVAEKFEAMTKLGLANSRMKDFFDLAWMATHFSFDGSTLVRAVRATFERRGTALPVEPPIGTTQEFAMAHGKATQWASFLRKAAVTTTMDLGRAIEIVADFLDAPRRAAVAGSAFHRRWQPPGPWT